MEGMNSSLLSSPCLYPNVSALLKIKILSWSQETGFPLCICVRIADRTFHLHKHPLISKSGYFMEKLKDSNEVELPSNFPGGAETFEMIALFIYGSSTLIDPFNIASLRCAAEFLQMTEEYCSGNLCERFDIYLNHVVFQSWDDTLIVLQKCLSLLPLAEELLIVSRCIETLAFMACMEILDPENMRRDQPVVTLEALTFKPWSDQMVQEAISRDLWIKDLIALPFPFFKRVVGSLRRQGMKEKYVTPILLFYAHKWLLINLRKKLDDSCIDDGLSTLEGIIDLLPDMGVKARKGTIPIGLHFSLLSACLELGLRDGHNSVEKVQNQIASVLHLARLEDLLLLLPITDSTHHREESSSIMETIFSKYFSRDNIKDDSSLDHNSTPRNLADNYIVAELWDMYLNQIATDSQLSCKSFMSLIETVPTSSRQTHDHLYRALNAFFQSHRDLSQEEKGMVCKYLNCQKMSQETCIEAVQNEVMPLRLIVQALFVQQLHTQQAFKECSDSFRYTSQYSGDDQYYFSGSLPRSSPRIYANSNSKSQNIVLGEIPYMNINNIAAAASEGGGGSRPLSSFLMMQKDDSPMKQVGPENLSSEVSRKLDTYESTSFRIQNLEKELVSLKMRLGSQHKYYLNQQNSKKSMTELEEPVSEKKLQSMNMRQPHCFMMEKKMRCSRRRKMKNPVVQVGSCIGLTSVNFASQRKYVNKLLKVLRRISFFGRSAPAAERSSTCRLPK